MLKPERVRAQPNSATRSAQKALVLIAAYTAFALLPATTSAAGIRSVASNSTVVGRTTAAAAARSRVSGDDGFAELRSSGSAEAHQPRTIPASVADGLQQARALQAAAAAAAAAGTAPLPAHNILERLNVRAVTSLPDPSISLTVDRYNQSRSGEWFTVRWSGVTDPRYDDWVALVVPADADLSYSAPAKWKYAAGDVRHVDTGSGELRFRLVSYRYDVAFAFLRNGFDTPVEVARSKPIKLLHPNAPTQVHLALTGKPGEMRVSWNTRDAGTRPLVEWWRDGGRQHVLLTLGGMAEVVDKGGGKGRHVKPDATNASNATTTTYTRDEMCGGPAAGVGWLAPGALHSAVMTALAPDTRYHYRVGDADSGEWSDRFTFISPPEVGPHSTVRVLLIADMGQGELDGSLEGSQMVPSLNTTRRMAKELLEQLLPDTRIPDSTRKPRPKPKPRDSPPPYTLLLHEGDISYARGYGSQWDNFLHQIEPVAAAVPYMALPGNHERDWPGTGDLFGVEDSGGECGVPFERRMPMPYPAPGKQWYAFEHGPLFVLQYDTEMEFAPGSEQYEFVVKTLRSVDRRRTPWLLVGGHRPPYVASTNANWPDGDQPVAQRLNAAFEDLWMQYKVDLTLHGHHHSYQRSCPVYKQECLGYDQQGVARAPIHMVIGNAGAGLSFNIVDPPPVWLEALKLWWGYVRLEANATCLTLESVSDEDGRVVDSLVLRKPEGWGEQYMKDRTGSREA